MDQTKGKSFPQDRPKARERKPTRTNRTWAAVIARLLIIPFLLFFSLLIGLIIGYGVLGDQPVSEVFNLNTYKHMYDLIFSGT
ncbi:DNA-directed RNA polymerase subunit beta [Brevibacillus fulvus]|uniref:DNA-directed RNA polymerase subunit beta n=1 Tax=Brevibacillus fulvus TaxID=1125967 RepID=A0A938Y203_9BACL|nr:DNA-directed RNA polymerase subunit beta [Brevibacillus fulvus]MBM7590157.1 hypothetical protein [Brevibacillus fulvus]